MFKNLEILKFIDQITFNTSKMMQIIKYQYLPMTLINLFSNKLVNRRHDQNNLPEFFSTSLWSQGVQGGPKNLFKKNNNPKIIFKRAAEGAYSPPHAS